MFCSNCGRPLDQGLAFCTNCGKEIAGNGAGEVLSAGDTLPSMAQLQRRIQQSYTASAGNSFFTTPNAMDKTAETGASAEQGETGQQLWQKGRQGIAFLLLGWLSFFVSLFVEPILLPMAGIAMGAAFYKYNKKQAVILIVANAIWLCITLFWPLIRMFRREPVGILV